MRGKNKVTIGFMTMMAVTGVVNVSSSFASDAAHVAVSERIGHGGSTYSSKSGSVGACRMKLEVVERIGAGGATYGSSQDGGCQAAGDDRRKVNGTERIGAGGSTYSSSESVS